MWKVFSFLSIASFIQAAVNWKAIFYDGMGLSEFDDGSQNVALVEFASVKFSLPFTAIRDNCLRHT